MDITKTSAATTPAGRCAIASKKFKKYTRGNSGEKRQHILDVAFSIFIERGYTNTKMLDIARAAGCGKSTLYEYFVSKDEILAELLQRKVVDRFESLADSIDPELPPREKLSAYLRGEMDIVLEYGANEALIAAFMTHPEYMVTPTLMETAHKIVRFNYMQISTYISEGMKDGSFNVPDPYIAASLVVGATTSYLGTITAPEYREFIDRSDKMYSEKNTMNGASGDAESNTTDEERRAAFLNLIFRAIET